MAQEWYSLWFGLVFQRYMVGYINNKLPQLDEFRNFLLFKGINEDLQKSLACI